MSEGLATLLCALQPPPLVAPTPIDVVAVHRAGWDQGYAAGEAAADLALAPLRLHLAQAAEALNAACIIDVDRLRPVFAALVRAVAEAVLAAELGAGAAVLLPLVEAALGAVRPGDLPTLVAHPDVLAVVAGHLPGLMTAADGGMAGDGFAVTGTDFIIDVALTARLDRVLGVVT